MKLDTTYDIPYGGGYSKDGQTIYIDKSIPSEFTTFTGEEFGLWHFLYYHEVTELELLKQGYTFNEAHRSAVGVEIGMLIKNNVPVDEYYGVLYGYVKQCLAKYKAGLSNLPPDLDMTPYIEDGIKIELTPGGNL